MSNLDETKTEDNGKKKDFTIIVNGRKKTVTTRELTFDDVVNLAFDNNPPKGENIVFTITYERGEGDKHEGSLVEGEKVIIKDSMIFNVTTTDKS